MVKWVSRTTRWRRSQQDQNILCHGQGQTSAGQEPHISGGHLLTSGHQQDEGIEGRSHINNENQGETDDREPRGIEDRNTTDVPSTAPLAESDIVSLLLAFTVRHGPSKAALGDLLDLLQVVGVTEPVPVSRYRLLKHVVEEVGDQSVMHFYCRDCTGYVS